MDGENREVLVPAPEKGREVEQNKEAEPSMENRAAATSEAAPPENVPAPTPLVTTKTPAPAPAKDATLMKVERVLEDNLSEIYFALPPAARVRFKSEGEQTASQIRILIEQGKAKARTVLDLIRKWLKLIPHVNRYFLQQESKIKTDRIMELDKKRREEAGLS